MEQEAYRDKARAVRREARAHLLELRRARQIRKGDGAQRVQASVHDDALSAPLAMSGDSGAESNPSGPCFGPEASGVASGQDLCLGQENRDDASSSPEPGNDLAGATEEDADETAEGAPVCHEPDAALDDPHASPPSDESRSAADSGSHAKHEDRRPEDAPQAVMESDRQPDSAGIDSVESLVPANSGAEAEVSGENSPDGPVASLVDEGLKEHGAGSLSWADDGVAVRYPSEGQSETGMAALAPSETDDTSFDRVASGSDLHKLPGAGAGLVWVLQQCGVVSLRDLAAADADALSERLGVVGRLLNVRPWIDFAREHTGQAS